MTAVWFRTSLIIVCSILGSGGFWAVLGKYFQSRDVRTKATTRLLMGVGYDKITTLGLRYIERGSITRDELEDFRRYYFEPYAALGGNGIAERIMREVMNLPFGQHDTQPDIFTNTQGRFTQHVQLVTSNPSQAPTSQ